MASEECYISTQDRGFIFGDAVYEVIPVYNNTPFAAEEHLQRLDYGLNQLAITNPHQQKDWLALIQDIVERSGGGHLSVYIQVTRGSAQRNHLSPEGIPANVFITTMPFEPKDARQLTQGVYAITAKDIRWARCDIKTTSLVANVLLKQKAHQCGAQEVILIKDGWLTEAGAANVFIVTDGQLKTPPADHSILPGITRKIIIDLAKQHQQTAIEQAIAVNDLFTAEEIWLSSSTREILPVTRLDKQVIGSGTAGRVWKTYKERLNQIT